MTKKDDSKEIGKKREGNKLLLFKMLISVINEIKEYLGTIKFKGIE